MDLDITVAIPGLALLTGGVEQPTVDDGVIVDADVTLNGSLLSTVGAGTGALLPPLYLGAGVLTTTANASVTNHGVIIGASLLAPLLTTNLPVGVDLAEGGSVTNDGSITGVPDGVLGQVNASTITNSGSISATGSTGIGVSLTAGGSVDNTSAVASITGIMAGIAISGSSASSPSTIDNLGSVTVTGPSGTGVSLDTGTVTNEAGGSISGGAAGVGVSLSGTGTVVNAGTIAGAGGTAVSFGAGGSKLVLDAGQTLSGIATAAGIGNVLELAAGTGGAVNQLSDIGTSVQGFATTQIDNGVNAVIDGGITAGASGTESVTLGNQTSLSIGGAVGAGVDIDLSGTNDTLTLNPLTFAGTITGLGADDTLDLTGLAAGTTVSYGNGGLTITPASGTPTTIALGVPVAGLSLSLGTGGTTDVVLSAAGTGASVTVGAGATGATGGSGSGGTGGTGATGATGGSGSGGTGGTGATGATGGSGSGGTGGTGATGATGGSGSGGTGATGATGGLGTGGTGATGATGGSGSGGTGGTGATGATGGSGSSGTGGTGATGGSGSGGTGGTGATGATGGSGTGGTGATGATGAMDGSGSGGTGATGSTGGTSTGSTGATGGSGTGSGGVGATGATGGAGMGTGSAGGGSGTGDQGTGTGSTPGAPMTGGSGTTGSGESGTTLPIPPDTTGIPTADNTPTVTGTAPGGSTVRLYDSDGTTVVGTGIADPVTGAFSITSSPLTDGLHSLTLTDTVGGVSSAPSAPVLYDIDTTGPEVTVDPTIAHGLRARTYISGTVADPAGVKSVEISVDGKDVGAADVLANGTWGFEYRAKFGISSNYTATATDGLGNTSSAVGSYDVISAIPGQAYNAVLENFDPKTGALIGQTYFQGDGEVLYKATIDQAANGSTVYTFSGGNYFGDKAYGSFSESFGPGGLDRLEVLNNRDGSHTINGLVDGQTITALHDDTITGGGSNETFVFKPHSGQELITDFQVSGDGHDVLALGRTGLSDLAAVIANTTMSGNDAVIQLPNSSTSITLAGVTKDQLAANAQDFKFHA